MIAVEPSPGVRVTVAESLRRDLVKVCEWCDLWRMKLNSSKTKTMIVSRSSTMHPQSPSLSIYTTVPKQLSNRGLGIQVKKCLYEGVIVPMALYRARHGV